MRYGLSGVDGTPLVLESGRGSVVFDVEGRQYLDLFAGAGRCLLGHGHPEFAAAVAEQAARLAVSRHATAARVAYIERLMELVPTGLDHITLFSTGSEAADAAVRIARRSTDRQGLIVFQGAFHGRTTGAAPLTDPVWRPTGSSEEPFVHRIPYPAVANGSAHRPEQVEEAIRQLHRVAAGSPVEIAAIVIEPVQGTAGNRRPIQGFLSAVEQAARDLRALLVVDEILAGFGRSGQMFVSTAEGVQPAMMLIGKGMGNGVPVSALLARGSVVQGSAFAEKGAMSSTFGGNPLAVAASAVTLDVLIRDDLPRAAAGLGTRWSQALREELGEHPMVTQIHGLGLMAGIELGGPWREGVDGRRRTLEVLMQEQGLLVGMSGDFLRLNPPLVTSWGELEAATSALRTALDGFLDMSTAELEGR
ncbi:aspartate aminotransferase family protein [Kitasatospora sp. NPDC056138]|uniref:aspartate aminotransferase family protein n=1 Tax=Kitasatospora sp. NPDC056138 TaxID=3345724 RepID=UPI0035DB8D63